MHVLIFCKIVIFKAPDISNPWFFSLISYEFHLWKKFHISDERGVLFWKQFFLIGPSSLVLKIYVFFFYCFHFLVLIKALLPKYKTIFTKQFLLNYFSLGPALRPVQVMMLICLHVCLFVCVSVPFPYILSDPQYFYRFRTPYKMTIRGAD